MRSRSSWAGQVNLQVVRKEHAGRATVPQRADDRIDEGSKENRRRRGSLWHPRRQRQEVRGGAITAGHGLRSVAEVGEYKAQSISREAQLTQPLQEYSVIKRIERTLEIEQNHDRHMPDLDRSSSVLDDPQQRRLGAIAPSKVDDHLLGIKPITSPGQSITHPLSQKMYLMAGLLSGRHSKIRDTQKML
ncbi:unnamed protein product [Trichogramma brassicae]|uniref:Uncharacterized protein n=1 Tax=Trichogramma brassicae TaxID=86971 RepID=A0A6H5J2B8_9HYME|nr:unnamed protein product [Trichogramma brassicae]